LGLIETGAIVTLLSLVNGDREPFRGDTCHSYLVSVIKMKTKYLYKAPDILAS